MKQPLSTSTVICGAFSVIFLIGTIGVFASTYSDKLDVDQYRETLEGAIVLDSPDPVSVNDGKYIMFSGVPAVSNPAASLANMPEGSIWYRVVRETYTCTTTTRHDSKGRRKTSESCSWDTTNDNENFGKIKIGSYDNISLDRDSVLQLGHIVSYSENGARLSTGDKWSGETSAVKGNVRYKIQSLKFDELSAVTVLGKQTSMSVVSSTINSNKFSVVIRKGKLTKDEMIAAAGNKAENAIEWTWTIVMVFISLVLLIAAFVTHLASKKEETISSSDY